MAIMLSQTQATLIGSWLEDVDGVMFCELVISNTARSETRKTVAVTIASNFVGLFTRSNSVKKAVTSAVDLFILVRAKALPQKIEVDKNYGLR